MVGNGIKDDFIRQPFLFKTDMGNEQENITAAIEHLLDCASGDTGGSRRAAQFLLSLWNGNRFKANLQELLYIDKSYFKDMQTVLQTLYETKEQLDTHVTENRMKPVVERWGAVFESIQEN
jgi:hypothetical protein